MTNITINNRNNTLVITKTFEKKASKFGTPEYMELKEAKADFPNFKVVVRTVKKERETYKGLTYAYMEKYIEKHDNNEDTMTEYKKMRNIDGENPTSYSFIEIRKWFLKKYPEIEKFYNRTAA